MNLLYPNWIRKRRLYISMKKLQHSSGKERHGIIDIALALAKKEDLKKEAAHWHKWRGIQHYYDGDYPKALDSFQEILVYWRSY